MIIQVFRDKLHVLLVSHLLVNNTQIQTLSFSVTFGFWDWCLHWSPYFTCCFSHNDQSDLSFEKELELIFLAYNPPKALGYIQN